MQLMWSGSKSRSVRGAPYPRVSYILRTMSDNHYTVYGLWKENQHLKKLIEDAPTPREAVRQLHVLFDNEKYLQKSPQRWLMGPMQEGLILDRAFAHVIEESKDVLSDYKIMKIAEMARDDLTKNKCANMQNVCRGLLAINKWALENGVEIVSPHKIIVGDFGKMTGYAGEKDATVIIRSVGPGPMLIDIKRSPTYSRMWGLQLAAYFYAEQFYDLPTDTLSPVDWNRDSEHPAAFVMIAGHKAGHKLIGKEELAVLHENWMHVLLGWLYFKCGETPKHHAAYVAGTQSTTRWLEQFANEGLKPTDTEIEEWFGE